MNANSTTISAAVNDPAVAMIADEQQLTAGSETIAAAAAGMNQLSAAAVAPDSVFNTPGIIEIAIYLHYIMVIKRILLHF